MKQNLRTRVLSFVLLLALLLSNLALAGCDSTPADTTTEQTSTSPASTSQTTTADTTTLETTYPPATVPSASSSTQKPPVSVDIPALTSAVRERLAALDNTNRGWGPGSEGDEKNRPIYAVSAEARYGQSFGSSYLMDDDKIYLTFDEGYENGYTAKILDVLKEKNVKAVFFITMSYAKNEPALVRRMIDEGHVIGNHSTEHRVFPTLTVEEAYQDVLLLHEYVLTNFGYEMTLFRFPEGASSDRMQALLQEMGYTSVFWSFAYRDYDTENQPDPAEALEKITKSAHPGAIYLLHAVSATNTAVLGEAIDYFRAAGYEVAKYPEA